MRNNRIGSSWEDTRKKLFTKDEIRESDLRVSLIEEFVKIRNEKGLTQKQLENLSGISQPVIARIERGTTNPQINTIVKLLSVMGKKLKIVSV